MSCAFGRKAKGLSDTRYKIQDTKYKIHDTRVFLARVIFDASSKYVSHQETCLHSRHCLVSLGKLDKTTETR